MLVLKFILYSGLNQDIFLYHFPLLEIVVWLPLKISWWLYSMKPNAF